MDQVTPTPQEPRLVSDVLTMDGEDLEGLMWDNSKGLPARQCFVRFRDTIVAQTIAAHAPAWKREALTECAEELRRAGWLGAAGDVTAFRDCRYPAPPAPERSVTVCGVTFTHSKNMWHAQSLPLGRGWSGHNYPSLYELIAASGVHPSNAELRALLALTEDSAR